MINICMNINYDFLIRSGDVFMQKKILIEIGIVAIKWHKNYG